jgi:hypothetical protein
LYQWEIFSNRYGRGVRVPVVRRVGVAVKRLVSVAVPRVAITVAVSGAPVRSAVAVGVCVGSRVGIGACVGVLIALPVGRVMIVAGAFVGEGARVAVGAFVGVAVRCNTIARSAKLVAPPQYIVSAPAIKITRQPYPSNRADDNCVSHCPSDGRGA